MSRVYSKVPTLRPRLEEQVKELQRGLHQLPASGIMGCLLFGSVARGAATYRSDIDLLVILRQDTLQFSDVQRIRDAIESHFKHIGAESTLLEPLPVQVTVVRDSVFETDEPEMRSALKTGLILVDPHGLLTAKLQLLREKQDDQ